MDDCQGCHALRAEAGSNAEFYARRLPVRGWAGKFSDAERIYLRHHPPEWYRLALARVPGATSKAREQTAALPEAAVADVGQEQAA
jgi:hypothetical protein